MPPGDGQETVLPTSLLAGRYRIERIIGEGAFGRVYLAFDTRLRRNVAIKELLAVREQTDRDAYERYVERFQREARATGTIQHANVVTAYDLHVDAQGNNYLVMEYVDGTNLRDLLAQVGTLPDARAIAITMDIANALEAVHEQEIVHRDVKPANIMITRRGTAKLMDFGIARIPHESQLTVTSGSHPGTPIYMSPEQSSSYGYIDGRSDLYSLGLVLYEMLVGEPFSRNRQPIGVVRPNLARPLIAIIDRLLARDANARYQSAADLLHDLQPLAGTAATVTDDYAYPGNPTPPGGTPPGAWSPTAPTGVVADVPSAYGGPPVPPQQGAPAYPANAPPSGFAGTGGYPPPNYPVQSGYGPPPSGPPPSRGNRGLIFGIGGALVAVIAVIGIVLFAMRGQSDKTATATPGPTAATPTTLSVTIGAGGTTVASTIAATPTVGATATGTVATATRTATVGTTSTVAATVSSTTTRTATTPVASVAATVGRTPTVVSSGQLSTWSEPNGLLKVQYPSNWTQTRDTTDTTNLVEFDGPNNGPFVYLFLDDPQQGTIQNEIEIIIRNQANSTKFTYTDQKTQDIQVGGQPGKLLTFIYTDKTDTTKSNTGAWWVVNNGGKQFSISASPLTTSSRADVDKIVASVTFANVKTTTFTDPDGIIRLQFPTDWQQTKDAADKTSLLSLSGINDEVHIFVYAYAPGSETYDQTYKKIRDADSDDGKTVRVYDPVLDTKVGGQPAKSLAYKYTAKDTPNAAAGIATIWLVDHNGKRYEFRCSNIALHRSEIEAVMNSVVFLK